MDRFCHGLFESETDKNKNYFLLNCLHVYMKEDYNNNDLLEYFVETFQTYLIAYFEKLDLIPRRKRRGLLSARGVYVEKKVGT